MPLAESGEAMTLTAAFVSGLFAILGVFAGAYVSRRSEYEKWLRAERAKVFAEFLRAIDEAFTKSSDALHDSKLDQLERDIEVTKAYSVPLNHARIVRLFLPPGEREEFEKLAKTVWSLHATKDLGDSRISRLDQKLNEIQALFERHL